MVALCVNGMIDLRIGQSLMISLIWLDEYLHDGQCRPEYGSRSILVVYCGVVRGFQGTIISSSSFRESLRPTPLLTIFLALKREVMTTRRQMTWTLVIPCHRKAQVLFGSPRKTQMKASTLRNQLGAYRFCWTTLTRGLVEVESQQFYFRLSAPQTLPLSKTYRSR